MAQIKRTFSSLILGSIVLLAFALRLHHLGYHSLWYDELLQLDIAQGPFFEIGPKLVRHAAMPLDYYLLFGWIKLGHQEAWVRFPALVFGVLSIPLIYALAKSMFNRRGGYTAALLLALSPFAVDYSQETRPYALLMSLTLLTMLGLWRAYQTGRLRYWAVAILGLVGAALAHYFAVFLLLPTGLFVAIQQVYGIRQRRVWQHTAFFSGAVLLLGLIFILNGRIGHLYSVGERFIRESDQLETYTVSPAEKPNHGSGPPLEQEFFIEKILTPLSTAKTETLLLYVAFLLVPVFGLLWPRAQNRAAVLLLLGWLILPIGLIYAFLLHRGTFFAIRYILYTLPAFLILVAYGITLIATWAVTIGVSLNTNRGDHTYITLSRGLLVGSLICFGLVPLSLDQLYQLNLLYNVDPYEDWRSVGQLLQNNAQTEDVVIAVRSEPAINWYYPPAAAPFGTYSRSEPIWQAMRDHKRRWFVLSSYSFKQDKGLRTWLKRQHAIKIGIDRRVVVYFHAEGESFESMLDQVKDFSLPQKPLTYRVLADQFRQAGDTETSGQFYQRAQELAKEDSTESPVSAIILGLLR